MTHIWSTYLCLGPAWHIWQIVRASLPDCFSSFSFSDSLPPLASPGSQRRERWLRPLGTEYTHTAPDSKVPFISFTRWVTRYIYNICKSTAVSAKQQGWGGYAGFYNAFTPSSSSSYCRRCRCCCCCCCCWLALPGVTATLVILSMPGTSRFSLVVRLTYLEERDICCTLFSSIMPLWTHTFLFFPWCLTWILVLNNWLIYSIHMTSTED